MISTSWISMKMKPPIIPKYIHTVPKIDKICQTNVMVWVRNLFQKLAEISLLRNEKSSNHASNYQKVFYSPETVLNSCTEVIRWPHSYHYDWHKNKEKSDDEAEPEKNCSKIQLIAFKECRGNAMLTKWIISGHLFSMIFEPGPPWKMVELIPLCCCVWFLILIDF